MMFQKMFVTSVFLSAMFFSLSAMAHTPLCSCFDNGDGTVTCEGAFSDGSSAAYVALRVLDTQGKILVNSKMDEDSECTFKKPSVNYKVVFDAGDGHAVEIDGKEIVE